MNADTYQAQAARTMIAAPDHQPTPHQLAYIHDAAQLAIMAGQLADLVKKGICHQQGLNLSEVASYLADISELCHVFGARINFTPKPADDQPYLMLWNTLGILGEAAELADALTGAQPDPGQVEKEAGDLCWYINANLTRLGLKFADALSGNIEKLKVRYPDGWNPQASQTRTDEA